MSKTKTSSQSMQALLAIASAMGEDELLEAERQLQGIRRNRTGKARGLPLVELALMSPDELAQVARSVAAMMIEIVDEGNGPRVQEDQDYVDDALKTTVMGEDRWSDIAKHFIGATAAALKVAEGLAQKEKGSEAKAA